MYPAKVNFTHYRIEFPDEILSSIGSRYFSIEERRKRLAGWLLNQRLRPTQQMTLDFQRAQIGCANEVFPEAALADPIADLEVWEEWRTGIRKFPYPGIYTRLNIHQQEQKTSASSSVGVLGEIFAGLFSQSYVAPLIVVRPIRHWPDFILLGEDQRYSFVESKASASLSDTSGPGIENVREELLGEGLADAVQELNAEPLLHVWLVFTDVISVERMLFHVSALEANPPADRQRGRSNRVPAAVIEGLADQAFRAAAVELEPELDGLLEPTTNRSVDEHFWQRLKRLASDRIREVLPLAVPPDLREAATNAIRDRIRTQKARRLNRELSEGRRLTEAKRTAAKGTLTSLRRPSESGQCLMLADLTPAQVATLKAGWRPDWRQANQLWGKAGQLSLWRCSSAVVGLGSEEHAGANIADIQR